MKALGLKTTALLGRMAARLPRGHRLRPTPRASTSYNRLVDELLANDIQPTARSTTGISRRRSKTRAAGSRAHLRGLRSLRRLRRRHLSDRVNHFMTLNEMSSFVNGYATGRHAPGLKLHPPASTSSSSRRCSPTVLACRPSAPTRSPAPKSVSQKTSAPASPSSKRPSTSPPPPKPCGEVNAGYLTVIMEGRYTDAYLAHAGADAPKFHRRRHEGHRHTVDFVGLNITLPPTSAPTTPPLASLDSPPESYPHMMSPWLHVGPRGTLTGDEACRRALEHQGDLHHRERTLDRRPSPPDGHVYDSGPSMYLRKLPQQLHRGVSEASPSAATSSGA